MHDLSIRNVLRINQRPTPGKFETDSNRFPGHENRMAAHIHRIRNHACERTDGKKCRDCVRGKL